MDNKVVITSAYRTAIGSYGKSLKNTNSFDLGSKVIQTSIENIKKTKGTLFPDKFNKNFIGYV